MGDPMARADDCAVQKGVETPPAATFRPADFRREALASTDAARRRYIKCFILRRLLPLCWVCVVASMAW